MSRVSLKNKLYTKVFERNGYNIVKFHSTEIVQWNDDEIILNTGGWESVTTKQRMNQTASERLLNYQVFQRDFQWYVIWNGVQYPFQGNTIRLDRNTGYLAS